ncbi:MAG: hybrid sensor histidine kinase/response regulator, partial [Desulfovibrio sp.]
MTESPKTLTPWKVIVADNEPEVHALTRMILGDVYFEGQPLELLDAASVAHVKELLSQHPDTAVILLEAVLGGESAGLEVVRHVRQESGNPFARIILRTG